VKEDEVLKNMDEKSVPNLADFFASPWETNDAKLGGSRIPG